MIKSIVYYIKKKKLVRRKIVANGANFTSLSLLVSPLKMLFPFSFILLIILPSVVSIYSSFIVCAVVLDLAPFNLQWTWDFVWALKLKLKAQVCSSTSFLFSCSWVWIRLTRYQNKIVYARLTIINCWISENQHLRVVACRSCTQSMSVWHVK